MASTIKLKNGSGAPLAGDLVQGEPALDLTNKRLYTEDSGGNVIEVGTNPSTIDINAGTIDGTVIGGSTAAAITGTTITGTSFVSSGDMTFGDNDRALFGAGSDLQIYHNGSKSIIHDFGTGNLEILADDFVIKNSTGVNTLFFADAPSGQVSLYHSNAAKLATTATGIDVTGTVTADGLTVNGGVTTSVNLGSLATGSSSNVFINKGFDGTAKLDFAYATAPYSAFRINVDSLETVSFDWNYDNNIATDQNITFTADGSRNLLNLNTNGDLSLYEDTGTTAKFFWDASAEMLTTSGLTVGLGNAEIQGTAPNLFLNETDFTGNNTRIMGQTKQFRIDTVDDNNSNNVKRFTIDHPTGDILFYEDTGTTAKFFWDASAESLGIGTSSPSDALVVEGDVASPHRIVVSNANASGSETLSFKQGATVKSWVEFNNSTSNFDVWQYTNNPLRFGTNNAERMRLDASGNLLVGKTSTSGGIAGTVLASSGLVRLTAAGIAVAEINRLTSDGSIVDFKKDGTTVGSIGTRVGRRLFTETGDTGLTNVPYLTQ
jgi:hypothetical protein